MFRFDSVIEQPAKRYGVAVGDALVYTLMQDAPNEDALPLLAFALQRLWRQFAASKALTRTITTRSANARGLSRIPLNGPCAVWHRRRTRRRCQDRPPSTGSTWRHRARAGARQVNDQAPTIRRVAGWNGFNEEQRDLLIRFDQWRLVVRKGGTDGGTVEVAHEALFREWARLKSWLEPERARLEALRSLQVDALTWDRNARSAAYLNHRDKRLAQAAALTGIEAYRKRLMATEFEYLGACQAAERSARNRRRLVQSALYVLVVGLIGGLIGWINQSRIKEQWDMVLDRAPVCCHEHLALPAHSVGREGAQAQGQL